MTGRHKWYFIITFILLCALIFSSFVYILKCGVDHTADTADYIAVLLSTVATAVGFFAIYTSVQNDKEIKRFEFLEEYNFNFLTNDEFIFVERMLESCNQMYNVIDNKCNGDWTETQENDFLAYCDKIFGSKNGEFTDEFGKSNCRRDYYNLISTKYQKIVNYLVYLEAFVPLLIHKQLFLDEVDDLFGYRYFIAMNNPVLQKNEIVREQLYYQGCIKEYKEWAEYRKDKFNKKQLNTSKKAYIPMAHYDLSNLKDIDENLFI